MAYIAEKLDSIIPETQGDGSVKIVVRKDNQVTHFSLCGIKVGSVRAHGSSVTFETEEGAPLKIDIAALVNFFL